MIIQLVFYLMKHNDINNLNQLGAIYSQWFIVNSYYWLKLEYNCGLFIDHTASEIHPVFQAFGLLSW